MHSVVPCVSFLPLFLGMPTLFLVGTATICFLSAGGQQERAQGCAACCAPAPGTVGGLKLETTSGGDSAQFLC